VICGGAGVLARAGVLVQAHGAAGLPDGTVAPSFRKEGLVGADHCHPLLDHRHDPRPGRSGNAEDPMSFSPTLFANKRFAVVGLGRMGLPAARALLAMGAGVIAWDDRAEARDAAIAEGLTVAEPDMAGLDALVLSPGIPHRLPQPHRLAAAAIAAGVPILS